MIDVFEECSPAIYASLSAKRRLFWSRHLPHTIFGCIRQLNILIRFTVFGINRTTVKRMRVDVQAYSTNVEFYRIEYLMHWLRRGDTHSNGAGPFFPARSLL